ncbi:MAG: CPBP family intramembrane glutamic endopeptidase [Promethearchaeota archaeon]
MILNIKENQFLEKNEQDSLEALENIGNKDQYKELKNFFLLTFVFSWIIWIIAPFISFGDVYLINGISIIGGYAPSLVAIILTSKNNQKFEVQRKKQVKIFLIIFILSLTIGIFTTLPIIQIIPFIVVGSIIAAYIFSSIYSSKKDVAMMLKTLRGIKGHNKSILIAIFLPLGFYLFVYIISLLFGGVYNQNFSWIAFLIVLLLGFAQIFFFGGPLNEEPGWRGFATPRLLEKYSPLITGLIIGVIWSIWHAPLHFNGFYGDGLLGFLLRFIYNIPFGIIFTWYYIKSQGNLLGCVFLHTSLNMFGLFFRIAPPSSIIVTIIIIITFYTIVVFLILQDRMYQKSN